MLGTNLQNVVCIDLKKANAPPSLPSHPVCGICRAYDLVTRPRREHDVRFGLFCISSAYTERVHGICLTDEYLGQEHDFHEISWVEL